MGEIRVEKGQQWGEDLSWGASLGKDQKLEIGLIRSVLPGTLPKIRVLRWSGVADVCASWQYKTMFLHFVHLCKNSHVKIYAAAPGRVRVAIRWW